MISVFSSVLRENTFEGNVRTQRFRDDDCSVRLLTHFENGEERAANRDRRAVEGMEEVRSLFALDLETRVQTARLVVRAVRRARDFAVRVATGHPRFDIVFAIRGTAEVSRRRVDDLVGNFEFVEDFALDSEELLMERFALFRTAEDEHFDFGELVNAIESARGATRGARFRTEAVADAAELQRELLRVDRLVGEKTAEGDLRRRDKAQVGVFDRIDLRFVAARNVTGALKDAILRQVGGNCRDKAFLNEFVHGELFERQFQQNGFVLQEIEARARDARSAFKVDEIELFCEFDVIKGLESLGPLRQRSLSVCDDRVLRVVVSDGAIRVRHVRNGALNGVELRFDFLENLLNAGELLANETSFFLLGFAFFRSLAFADRLGDDVRVLVERFDFALLFTTGVFKLDETINVRDDVAIFAVEFNGFDVF